MPDDPTRTNPVITSLTVNDEARTFEMQVRLPRKDVDAFNAWLELFYRNAAGKVCWRDVHKQFETLGSSAQEVAAKLMDMRRDGPPPMPPTSSSTSRLGTPKTPQS